MNASSITTTSTTLRDREAAARAGGRALVWIVRRLLRRWHGRVPARLDWFAGRGVRPLSAAVVNPHDADGRSISDHAAIVCDLARDR